MASSSENAWFPPLRLPDPKTFDAGNLRLGDTAVTGKFPPLRSPDSKTFDPGIVRLGDTAATGRFPLRR